MAQIRRDTAMEPSVEEKNLYFSGLPSCPRLVARSNFDITFTPGNGGIFWPVKKFLWPTSPNHPIVALWDGPLRGDIINALDGINWTAIDILRLGFHKNPDRPELPEPELPHVLLVSVVNTTWQQGFQAVMSCRRIMEFYGLDDIHCEMKESIVERSTSTPNEVLPLAPPRLIPQLEAPPANHPNIHHRHFISENLGVSIASFDNPTREGTKGLYLRRKDTGAILALTCRHVVCDISQTPNEPYQHSPDTTPPWLVIQPGAASLDTMLTFASKAIPREENIQFRVANNINHTEENRQRLLTESQNRLSASIPWTDHLQSITAPKSRIIGHVLCSPRVSLGTSPSGNNRLRDWALIELHPDRHQTELADLKNTVPLSTSERDLISVMADEQTPGFPPSLNYDGRLVTLDQAFMTEDEIKKPTTKDSDNEAHLVVAMYGRTSNFSIGYSNGIMSVKREVINGRVQFSEEWCILGQKSDSSMGSRAFSRGGDSGSCIWNMEGRVAGLLLGGNGSGHYGMNDTTYAHPIEWILADIRNEFGIDVELL